MIKNKYLKALLAPYQSYLKIRLKMKRSWIDKNCKSYDDFFEDEIKNSFAYTKDKAKLALGYSINLNKPQTFNEKLIHRRLFSRDPVWPIITDKISVLDWLKENKFLSLVNVVPYKVVFSVKELIELPIDKPVVIKAAWASGMNFFASSNEELMVYEKKLTKWFDSPYKVESLIWAAECMKRGFIVSENISSQEDAPLTDYKFFVINGVVKFFQVEMDREEDLSTILFDKSGAVLPYSYNRKKPDYNYSICDESILKEMIYASEKIGGKFSFIRVDFFVCNNKAYFAELSQTPHAGFGRFSDQGFDKYLGKLWNYPESNKLGDLLISGNEL